jgi:hypothetical protein
LAGVAGGTRECNRDTEYVPVVTRPVLCQAKC